MTIFPLSYPKGRMIKLPTRSEIAAMLNRPSVFITAIVCGLVAFLAVLGGVVLLAYTGHSTEAVTSLLGGSLLVLVLNLRSKVNEVHDQVKQQNGTLT